MGYIANYFVRRAIDVASSSLSARQDRLAELCETVGVDMHSSSSPKSVISDSTFFSLLEHIAREFTQGYEIGVRVGATMRCDDYGAFGLAFKTARDIAGSFQRVERYGKVVTTVANYTVNPGKGSSFMALQKDTSNRLGLLLTNELAIAAGCALSREVSLTGFSPLSVHFSHPAPPARSFYEDYFQCPVYFNSDRNGFEVGDTELYAANRLGDEAVSTFFDSHLDGELEGMAATYGVSQQVAKQISQTLSEGVPSIGDIAARLAMSRRTLQRRLAEEGIVFQQLLDDTRRDLAIRLLESSEYSLAEIAFLTGYAEQSTFTRAFKRWRSQTPAGFRRELH